MSATTPAQEAVARVRQKFPESFQPELALILGSGLSDVANGFNPVSTLPYEQVPGFVPSTVSGHKGALMACEFAGKKLLVLSGRFHFYEGHPLSQITFPVRFVGEYGIKILVLTAAVGGVNLKFRPGELALVHDHINFTGNNPLIGPHHAGFGERFPDLSDCYNAELRKLAQVAARKKKIHLRPAVYLGVSGPSYETAAEIRAFRKLGADVVGMSVVPEAIVAAQMKLKVLALCYVSNMACGITRSPLSHQEVLETGRSTARTLGTLLQEVVQRI